MLSMINNTAFSVFAISCAMFMRMLGVFMALPVMAYGAEGLLGSTTFLVGLAIGIHGLSQAALQIPFGYLSDVWQRKHALLLGMSLFLFGSLISAFSTSIWGLIFGRFLQGCGAVGSVSLAFILDKVEDSKQSIAIAAFGMSIGAAFVAALFTGPLFYNSYGIKGVFYIGSALAFLSFLLIMLVPNNTVKKTNVFNGRLHTSVIQAFTGDINLPLSFLVVFLIHASLASYFSLLPKLVGAIDYKVYLYPVIISVLLMATSPIKNNRIDTMKVSLFLMAVAQLLPVFGLGKLSFSMFLVSFIILETILPSIVSKGAPEGKRGISLGIYTTFQFLGVFLGGSLSGFVLNYLDVRVVPLLASIVTLSVLVVVLLYTKTKGVYTVLVER